MCKHYHKVNIITMLVFLIATFFSTSALFLTNRVSATDPSVTDEINITVPVSCSLSGTGMDTHTTELHNTESDSAIGESTITAYCNDLNGLSIYAVGFTNNEYGNNNLVSVTASTTNTIPTGTNTSGNTSSWAMKLTPITNPAPTYPITIIGSTDDTDKTPTTLDYTSFQSVPNEYALVARRKASTDVGTNAEGSSFKTTYQAYAASGQAAGTYEGQVKYTLIHPYHEIDSTRPNHYYVVHSGTGEIEVLPLSDDGNLTTKVADGFIYGGYYKSYGGVDSDAVNSLIAQYENGEVDDLTISSFKTYTAENMGELRNAWNIRDAYTEYGNAVGVEKGRVYYLKEVPDTYLRPASYRLFHKPTNQLQQYIMISVTDDLNYRRAGFYVTKGPDDYRSTIATSLTITFGSTSTEVLYPGNTYGNNEYGYISWAKHPDFAYTSEGDIIQKMIYPYFVTPDGLMIRGKISRFVTIKDSNNDGIVTLDEVKEVVYTYASTPKIYSGETDEPPLILGGS